MPFPPPNVNDGSGRPPRLAVYGNGWGLSELPRLPRERAWTLEETLDRIAAAGFEGIQAWPSFAEAARRRGLRYCRGARVNQPEEADALLQDAAETGAECVTLHVGWGMEDDAEMDRFARAVLQASDRRGIPAYIETHRATITQDIFRTLRLVERIPEIRFNGDFSHYYCGHEMTYRGFEAMRPLLDPILRRASFFHGRVANGSHIQVDIGDGRDDPHARNFRTLWTEAMGHWLEGARPGDLLPFAPELGPPSSDYAVTWRDGGGRLVEISDRWEQTLVIKRLAEEAFAEAVRRRGPAPIPPEKPPSAPPGG